MGTTHHTTRRKCTTDLEFSTNTLLTKLTLVDICHRWSPSIGWSPTAPRMVTHATRRKSTTYLEFSTYTLLTKLTLVDICHIWLYKAVHGCTKMYMAVSKRYMDVQSCTWVNMALQG